MLLVCCRVSQPAAWSNWPLSDDVQLTGVYGVQSAALGHGHSDPDDIISSLYARMLIAETGGTTSDDCWPADVGLLPGCRPLGVGGGLAETESVVPGLGGGGLLAELYDHDGGNVPWNALSGFFDGDLAARHLRAGLSAAAGDESVVSAGPWRRRPDLDVSAAVSGGSDGATSPSYSPTESSTGSAG